LNVAPQMHCERRQGGWGDTLNTASGAQSGWARGFQALAHFSGKPNHGIEIKRFGNGGLFFAFQKAPLGFLAPQIRRVECFRFQLRAYGGANFPQPRKGGFNPFHRHTG
jgi:hypothetical protein